MMGLGTEGHSLRLRALALAVTANCTFGKYRVRPIAQIPVLLVCLSRCAACSLQMVIISAKTGMGLDSLKEALLLQAEVCVGITCRVELKRCMCL